MFKWMQAWWRKAPLKHYDYTDAEEDIEAVLDIFWAWGKSLMTYDQVRLAHIVDTISNEVLALCSSRGDYGDLEAIERQVFLLIDLEAKLLYGVPVNTQVFFNKALLALFPTTDEDWQPLFKLVPDRILFKSTLHVLSDKVRAAIRRAHKYGQGV